MAPRISAALLSFGLLACQEQSGTEAPVSSTGPSSTTGTSSASSMGGAGSSMTATTTTATSSSSNGGVGGAATSSSTGEVSSTDGTAGAAGASGIGELVGDIVVEPHGRVNTLLWVSWTQLVEADSVWLEFSYEGGPTMTSRPAPGSAGAHREVVLGVPPDTVVTGRIVSSLDGMELGSATFSATTGSLPSGMPTPEVSHDAALASPERWMFGAVEDSDGGCANPSCYYHTTFWLYIMNRQGQIVWYYADPASNATSSFQRIARDGEYIWIEKRPFGGGAARGVLKMTLDWEYFEEVEVPGLSDCIDVTEDGSLLYDTVQSFVLREMSADGEVSDIWSCPEHFGNNFVCYSNTINYNQADDSILLSFPDENTVIQIDRESGDVVGQYGDAAGSYAFSPDTWEFEYQHFPNITPDGTLLLSSHMPGYADTNEPVAGQHAFMEFEIDRDSETLIERWVYNDGQEWAMFKGMAIRLDNGNTLANYGTGGVIREITPDKQTAFEVKFDVASGNDFFNKMVGHNVLIDDLYALNGGPQ